MNRRLRQLGQRIPSAIALEPPPGRMHESGCALCDVTSSAIEPDVRVTRYINQSFVATHDDPLLMDTEMEPKLQRGGRHRRQR